jgi:hypothetical protein
MKRLLPFSCLFFLASFLSGQTLENEELKGKYDSQNNTVSFVVDSLRVDGSIENILEREAYYKDETPFIVLDTKTKIVLVSFTFKLEKTSKINSISKLFVLEKNDSSKTIKRFLRGKLKDENILYKYDKRYDKMNSFDGLPLKSDYWSNLEKIREDERDRQKEKEKVKTIYAEKTGLREYEGVYEVLITIYEHRKLPTPFKGKLYISDAGVSLISDLPANGTIRGNHLKDVFMIKHMRESKGFFSGPLSKGFGNEFGLSINESKKSGGLTLMSSSVSITIAFNIIKKIGENK